MPIQTDLELAISETITASLASQSVTGLPVLAGRNTNDTVAPYVVVAAQTIEETTPGSGAFRFEMKVVVVSNLDDSTSLEHDARCTAMYAAIASIPRFAVDVDHGVQLLGFTVMKQETAEEEQAYGDVWTIEGGCQGYSP